MIMIRVAGYLHGNNLYEKRKSVVIFQLWFFDWRWSGTNVIRAGDFRCTIWSCDIALTMVSGVAATRLKKLHFINWLNSNCKSLVWIGGFVSSFAQSETGAAGIRTIYCRNLWIPSWITCSWQSSFFGKQAAVCGSCKPSSSAGIAASLRHVSVPISHVFAWASADDNNNVLDQLFVCMFRLCRMSQFVLCG